jgi:hypothetical protein
MKGPEKASRKGLSGQRPFPHSRWQRLAFLFAGLWLGQFFLYGPSLIGQKILLPLDILAQPGCYLPVPDETETVRPHNYVLMDLVTTEEPTRRFMGSELRAGRLPLWNPSQYAGAPLSVPKFSPFSLLLASFPSPTAIAWVHLLAACVAGGGAYVFCRKTLHLSYWPAAVMGWTYPLTAFFVYWQGYRMLFAIVWLPWLLAALHRTARHPHRLNVAAVALLTGLTLVSGQLDMAGQVLLVSTLYGLWQITLLAIQHRRLHAAIHGLVALLVGGSLGLLLAAADILPIMEYARTGARMLERSRGEEERPPVGLPALPQMVIPTLYGSTEKGSLPLFPKGQGNVLESSAAGYIGLFATLLLVPLSWSSPRHRPAAFFLTGLAVFALGWFLNIPGLVSLLRLPFLNMMSHNRLVFAAAFALSAMAAIGMDLIARHRIRWQFWFWFFPGLAILLGAWNVFRAAVPPEPIATQLAALLQRGESFPGLSNLADLHEVRAWFATTRATGAFFCLLTLGGWIALWRAQKHVRWLFPLAGLVAAVELLSFGMGRSAQCDPRLYYPPIPALEELAQSNPGRIVGYESFPAKLGEMAGLRDIRGYDAVDPARLMDLMAAAAHPKFTGLPYARTQWYIPAVREAIGSEIRLSPLLDMLGVTHVIFRGTPPPTLRPVFQSPDYWILANPSALPRVFIPARVESISDARERLEKLTSPLFDARQIAYVESAFPLPALESCRGSARIVDEVPTRITLAAEMETAGLLVLADSWNEGWRAFANGIPVPSLRTNHALRGVLLPAGKTTLEFRYEPCSLMQGFLLAAAAAAVLIVLVGTALLRRK